MERDRNDGRPALLVLIGHHYLNLLADAAHPGLDHAERDVLFEPR